jgi:hypothetical protein
VQTFRMEFNVWMDAFKTFATELFKKWFLIEIKIASFITIFNLCMENKKRKWSLPHKDSVTELKISPIRLYSQGLVKIRLF